MVSGQGIWLQGNASLPGDSGMSPEIERSVSLETYQPQSWSPLRITPVSIGLHLFLGVLMALVVVISAMANGAVIYVTLRYKDIRKPLNCLLLNLAVGDLLSAVIGGTPTVVSNFYGSYVLGKMVCMCSAFIVATMGIVDLMSITLLGFSRYLVTCKPCGYGEFNHKQAVCGVTATWIWSIAWHIPPWLWGGYDIHGIGTSCGANWTEGGHSAHIYLMLYFAFCFFFPLMILTWSYIAIWMHVRKGSRMSTLGRQATIKTERKTICMIFTIKSAFLICWTPYAVLGLYEMSHPKWPVNQYISMIPVYLAKTATIYNACIYIWMNNKLRIYVFSILAKFLPFLRRKYGENGIALQMLPTSEKHAMMNSNTSKKCRNNSSQGNVQECVSTL